MMGDSCKVSIILPMFNMEATLSETLDSAIRNAEALGDAEILVIDDGSTDGSLGIAFAYAERHPMVRVHERPHLGSGAARNFGLSVARGEYIAFLDADDFYPEDTTLLRLYETAREKDAAICGGSLATCTGEGPWQTEYGFPYDGNVFREEGYMEYADYQYDFAYYRFLYRRDLLQGVHFPDLLRFQDVPFFVEAMIKAGRFYALKEPTYVYRLGHKSVEWTWQKARDLLRGLRMVLSLAKRMEYQHLYHIAYLQYRDYEQQGVFLRGMRDGEHPHRVFLSWLRLIHGMDRDMLASCGFAWEETSIRWLVRKVFPYMDVEELLGRIREEGLLAGNCEETEGMAAEDEQALQEAERFAARIRREESLRRQDTVCHLMVQWMGARKLARMLRQERDSFRWFSYLKYVAARYLVILVVKDTPGSSMPPIPLKSIRETGFDLFNTELWRTYIGVIYRGQVFFQGFHENEEGTEYVYEFPESGLRLFAASQAWRRGNRAMAFS